MITGIAFVTIVVLWSVTLVILKNLKMDFFKFFVGSLGLFTITMIFFMNPLEKLLIDSLNWILYIIGNSTGWFDVIKEYSTLIYEGTHGGIITMGINYQCSGIIELLVFSCLVVFFPFVNNSKKFITLILGNLYLFVANIIRILFIVAIVSLFGVESYEIAHIALARILFFILTIYLYYKVFTKSQLKNQKVGGIR